MFCAVRRNLETQRLRRDYPTPAYAINQIPLRIATFVANFNAISEKRQKPSHHLSPSSHLPTSHSGSWWLHRHIRLLAAYLSYYVCFQAALWTNSAICLWFYVYNYIIIIYMIYTLHIVWIYLPSNLAASTSISQYPFDPIRLFAFLAIYMCISKSVCKCWKNVNARRAARRGTVSQISQISQGVRCAQHSVVRWPEPTLAPWMPSTADLDFHSMCFLTQRCYEMLGILGMFSGMFLGNWTELGWTWLN